MSAPVPTDEHGGAIRPLDVVAGEAKAHLEKARLADKHAENHRIAAGQLLIEARNRIATGTEKDQFGRKIIWSHWAKEHFKRSRQDIYRVMKIAASPDPVAALAIDRAQTRERVAGIRENVTYVRDKPSPQLSQERPSAGMPADTVRRDQQGNVLDPIPVVLRRALVRLGKAEELDRQIRKVLGNAVATLRDMAKRGKVAKAFGDDMAELRKLADQAGQHRNGVIVELEEIVAELAPPSLETIAAAAGISVERAANVLDDLGLDLGRLQPGRAAPPVEVIEQKAIEQPQPQQTAPAPSAAPPLKIVEHVAAIVRHPAAAPLEMTATGPLLPAENDSVTAIFTMWEGLKPNTRLRVISWVEADCPTKYPPIDDIVTIADAAKEIRETINRTSDDTVIERFLARAKDGLPLRAPQRKPAGTEPAAVPL